jgi:hypothetical protein
MRATYAIHFILFVWISLIYQYEMVPTSACHEFIW